MFRIYFIIIFYVVYTVWHMFASMLIERRVSKSINLEKIDWKIKYTHL